MQTNMTFFLYFEKIRQKVYNTKVLYSIKHKKACFWTKTGVYPMGILWVCLGYPLG